jgi:GTPase SAR1 family protein
MDAAIDDMADPRRVVVVGPCASGKSTLVEGLRRLGFEATVCGQEHSEIPTLWRRADPDVVVALEVDLPTVRRRRGEEWPEWLYLLQRRRLRQAAAAADVSVDTSVLDEDAVLQRVAAQLRRDPPRPAP